MQTQRRGNVAYADLIEEMEGFEKEFLQEDCQMAMNFMVLEAKIRDRFQQMESRVWDGYATLDVGDRPDEDGLSSLDIQAMIPRDICLTGSRPRTVQTVSMAAVLAVLTAVSVFGLASVLQLVLSWIA